jgi:hypothetical protein
MRRDGRAGSIRIVGPHRTGGVRILNFEFRKLRGRRPKLRKRSVLSRARHNRHIRSPVCAAGSTGAGSQNRIRDETHPALIGT